MAKSQETYENISRWKKHERERAAALEADRERKVAHYLKKAKKEKTKFAKEVHDPLLTVVYKKANKLLDAKEYRDALLLLKDLEKDWVRSPKDWEPKGKGRDRLFRSLASHLLAKYPMPNIIWEALFDPRAKNLLPFVQFVASGGSVAKASKQGLLPVKLNKKQCHRLMTMPCENFLSAIRRIQVETHGGDERLHRVWLETSVGRSFSPGALMENGALIARDKVKLFNHSEEEFWDGVLRWFAAQSMLDTNQIGPLVDYINHLRDLNPDTFSMKGRTAAALLRGMNQWHDELNQAQREANRNRNAAWLRQWRERLKATYNPSGIKPYQIMVEVKNNKGKKVKQNWTITEILSYKDLEAEGKALHHCVASYHSSIESGRTSIWSLKCEDKRLVTIEVVGHCIVQARGAFNRRLESKEYKVINQWASKQNLGMRVS